MLTLGDVLTGTKGWIAWPWPGDDVSRDIVFTAIVIDSRQVVSGALFFALPGTAMDGHEFLGDAAAHGAQCAVVSEVWLQQRTHTPNPPPLPVIAVPETLIALHDLAAWWRGRFPNTPVVGITGSVGKTSAKEAIAAVLGTRYRVVKTPGNFNAITSMPLVLLDITAETEVAVIEMSLYDPGDIATMTRIAAPTIGVVTTIGMSHVERLGSQAAIIRNKGDLIAGLPADGVAVLNGDDREARRMQFRSEARCYMYGTLPINLIRATEVTSRGLDGIAFDLHLPGASPRAVISPMLGTHNVYAALSAATVGYVLDLTPEEIARGLAGQQERLRLTTAPGPNGATLIDDTYNSSPQSAIAALDLLASLDARRRVAVLADMFELGDYSAEAYEIVGTHAAKTADVLYAFGPRSVATAEAARMAGMPADAVVSIAADDKDALAARLRAELAPGDLVLVKGSRGMHMDELIAALRVDGGTA